MKTPSQIDEAWKSGEREAAKQDAKEWVKANREEALGGIYQAVRKMREARLDDEPSRDEMVELVSAYRAAGELDSALVVKTFLLGEYEPRKITGAARIVRGGGGG